MPKISAFSSATPGSTALLAAVVNTTTVKVTAADIGLAAGGNASSGQYLKTSSGSSATIAWTTDRWGVTAQFNAAAASAVACFRVPFDCFIDEWDMALSTGPTSAVGSATVEVRVNGRSSTPSGSATQISSGTLPTISNATNNGSSAISSWTSTSLTEDTWVTLYLATVSSADTVYFSLGGKMR